MTNESQMRIDYFSARLPIPKNKVFKALERLAFFCLLSVLFEDVVADTANERTLGWGTCGGL